jgi:ATP-dependent DNA helicase PIF1
MELIILLIIVGGAYFLGRSSKDKSPQQYQPKPANTNYQHSQPQFRRNDRLINQKRAELKDVVLSDEQQQLFEKLENTSTNVFVTGKAGTGKSLLLQYFRAYTKKKMVVVAPTGVAALNVGGQTIHSLFKLPLSVITKDKQKDLRMDSKTAFLLKNLDTVVIDEISMVRVDTLEAIDCLLKKARNSDLPFGGVQMVMFGDLYQLPPVVSSRELQKYFADTYGGVYCFNAFSWKAANPEIIELSNIFRQKDSEFIDLLNTVRNGSVDDTLLIELNKRATVEIPSSGTITLATTNRSVREINDRRLNELPGEAHEFQAEITGQLEESAFPTEEILRLKVGAQIMMLRNDREKRWVNGTLGTIKSISGDEIKVDIDGHVYTVSPETWSKISYYYNREEQKVEEEVVSTFRQFPLRLAWAITIHKSQGQTYSSVVIDLGDGAFAHGQTYVALSRCTQLETLYLKRDVYREDVIVDSSVVAFMETKLRTENG